MLLLRKILFGLFFSLYIVLCPLLVLYALGYIFTPHAEESLTRTGVIRLVSYPSDAMIFINGKNTGEKSPATFSSLRQGSYQVRVEKKDYLAWQADVLINPPRAEVIDPLILIPQKKQFEIISNESFDYIDPILKTDYLLLFRGNKIKDAAIFNIKDNKLKPLRTHFAYEDAQIINLFKQRGDTRVVINLKQKGKYRFVLLDLREERLGFKDITSFFVDPARTENVFWRPEEKRYLFVQREDVIDRIDLDTESLAPKWIDEILGSGIGKNEVFALKKDMLIEKEFTEEAQTEVHHTPFRFQALLDRGKSFTIEKIENDNYVFMSEEGEFLMSRFPYRISDEAILGYEIDKKHQNVLLWTEHQIGTMKYREKNDDKPFQQGPALRWLFTKASRIEKAFLAHEGSHILFQDKDRVYLMRSKPYPDEKPNEFFRVRGKTHFYYAEQKGSFYFLDRRNSRLISWKLIPDEDLLQFMRISDEERERVSK